jgi:hypothetical protein
MRWAFPFGSGSSLQVLAYGSGLSAAIPNAFKNALLQKYSTRYLETRDTKKAPSRARIE